MISDAPVLYSFRRCPYAMRARLALASSGRVCALREVVLRDKPAEMIAASPKGTVPVLVLPGGRVIDESLDIMLWALQGHDPEEWLAPLNNDPGDVEALIAENDGAFKRALDRYKYPTRYDGVDPVQQREAGLAFLEKLDARLQKTAFLYGNGFSLADAAIFPFVRQFANTDRAWFDGRVLPGIQRWLQENLESERFLRVMAKYAAWMPGGTEIVFFPE